MSGTATLAGTVAGDGTVHVTGPTTGGGTIGAAFIDAGTLSVGGGTTFTGTGDSFAGAISGAGTLTFGGGTDTIKDGTPITTTALDIAGGAAVTFEEDLTYAGIFTAAAGTTLAMAQDETLTLTNSRHRVDHWRDVDGSGHDRCGQRRNHGGQRR